MKISDAWSVETCFKTSGFVANKTACCSETLEVSEGTCRLVLVTKGTVVVDVVVVGGSVVCNGGVVVGRTTTGGTALVVVCNTGTSVVVVAPIGTLSVVVVAGTDWVVVV